MEWMSCLRECSLSFVLVATNQRRCCDGQRRRACQRDHPSPGNTSRRGTQRMVAAVLPTRPRHAGALSSTRTAAWLCTRSAHSHLHPTLQAMNSDLTQHLQHVLHSAASSTAGPSELVCAVCSVDE